jgi:hypothetical protein
MEDTDAKHWEEAVQATDGTLAPKAVRGLGVDLAIPRQVNLRE